MLMLRRVFLLRTTFFRIVTALCQDVAVNVLADVDAVDAVIVGLFVAAAVEIILYITTIMILTTWVT